MRRRPKVVPKYKRRRRAREAAARAQVKRLVIFRLLGQEDVRVEVP